MTKVLVGKTADGKDLYGESIRFEARANEPWVEYDLGDGNILRVRMIVTHVLKTDQVNDVGEPVYVIRSQQITNSLRKQEGGN